PSVCRERLFLVAWQLEYTRSQSMKLSPAQLQLTRKAFLDAFRKRGDLEMLVGDIGENLNAIAAETVGLETVVFELVRWAETRGRLRELLVAATAARPKNATFAEMATLLAPADRPDDVPPR